MGLHSSLACGGSILVVRPKLKVGDSPAAVLGGGALEGGGGHRAIGVTDLPRAGSALQGIRGGRLHCPLHTALGLLILQDGPVKHIVPLVPCTCSSETLSREQLTPTAILDLQLCTPQVMPQVVHAGPGQPPIGPSATP